MSDKAIIIPIISLTPKGFAALDQLTPRRPDVQTHLRNENATASKRRRRRRRPAVLLATLPERIGYRSIQADAAMTICTTTNVRQNDK
ncbi:hypothetical protein KQX54_017884 [Cotesia glomerata]|uniref:Uncharacterized protein n=1 Tax=Cotesia glomerata TaxID=32391 RepID=A0AAV7IGI5_COTGL|nr:hypothetical protein KQX54_017884 [Cotesia glomerata]